MLDHSVTLQAIMELWKSLSELAAKTDRLIKDVQSQSGKSDAVRHQVTFARDVLWVVVGLVVLLCGTVVPQFNRLEVRRSIVVPPGVAAPAR